MVINHIWNKAFFWKNDCCLCENATKNKWVMCSKGRTHFTSN